MKSSPGRCFSVLVLLLVFLSLLSQAKEIGIKLIKSDVPKRMVKAYSARLFDSVKSDQGVSVEQLTSVA